MVEAVSILHTYVVYSLLGSTLAYFLAVIAVRYLRVEGVRCRSGLLWTCLAMPLVAYLTLHLLWPGRMQELFAFSALPFWQRIVGVACLLGYWGSRFLYPLLGIAFGLAGARLAFRHLSARHVVKRYGWASLDQYPQLKKILLSVSQGAGVDAPRLVVTANPAWSCYTFGTRRPVLVISQGALCLLEEEELEAVLAHEIAHIRRKDNLTSGLALLLRDLMFFSPVAYWAYNALLHEKEKAADELAVNVTGKPLVYSSTLIRVWRHIRKAETDPLCTRWYSYAYPNFLWEGSSVALRVARIIEPPARGPARWHPLALATVFFTVIYLLSFAC